MAERLDWEKLLNADRLRPSSLSGSDGRSQFERDYDRTIFSTPVRRLQDKAQVFPLEPHDAVRTRLTHSIEVSTVARDLAGQLGRWLEKNGEIDSGRTRDLQAIAATCGLIHDLGNPPFGHAGEQAIQTWAVQNTDVMTLQVEQQKQDFLKFEGNAQTLRIVSKLQVLADFYGLNLTVGTLSAACKYTAQSDTTEQGKHELRKPGYFASENELVAKIRDLTGTHEARNPLTYVVEAADDIVYSTVDIEDAIKKGVIGRRAAFEFLSDDYEAPIGVENVLSQCFTMASKILGCKDIQVDHDHADDVCGQAFRTAAIAIMAREVVQEFKNQYDVIMNGNYHGELIADSSAASLIRALKKLAKSRIYTSPETLRLEVMGREVIHNLMNLFWEGAKGRTQSPKDTGKFEDKLYHLMSSNYRKVFEEAVKQEKPPADYCQLQLVTDYICGMTDTFACTLHRQLTNG